MARHKRRRPLVTSSQRQGDAAATARPADVDPRRAAVVPRWVALTALALAVIAAYGGTLRSGFVHDDQSEIVKNRFVHDLRHVQQILTRPSWGFERQPDERPGVDGYYAESNYYRPVQYLTYAALYSAFGPAPSAFHAWKLLLHLCACILLWAIVRSWREDLALPAAGLFAVHPALSEAVAWISAITDALCGLCFLLAFGAYLYWRRRPSFVRLALLYAAFLVGMFSKETMLVFLPVLLVYQRVCEARWPSAADWKRVYTPLALVATLYLVMRVAALGSFLVPVRGHFAYLTGTIAVMNQFVLVSDYLSRFVRPEPLNAFHVFEPVLSAMDRRVGFAVAVICAVVTAVVLVARRLSAPERRLMLFGIIWALAALAPAILFFRRIGDTVFAERYLYLPFAGLSIAAVAALSGVLERWPRTSLVVLSLLMALGAWRVRERVVVFDDSVAFYEDALRQSPTVSLWPSVWQSLADAYQDAGRTEDALAAYRRMLALEPQNYKTYCNMGVTYQKAGRLDEAIAAYRASLAIEPNEMAYSNLGIAYHQLGRFDDAIRAYRDALALRPTARNYHNLGTTYYLGLHRLPEAVAAYEAALRLEPDRQETRQALDLARRDQEAGASATRLGRSPVASRVAN